MATHDTSSNASPPSPSQSLSAVDLLRAKLILSCKRIAPSDVYEETLERYPDALDHPWSKSMDQPIKHVVLNGLSFDVSEVDDAKVASRISGRPPIEAGNGIMLYVNDVLMRRTERSFQRWLGSSPTQLLKMIDPAMQTPFYHLEKVIIAANVMGKGRKRAEGAAVDVKTK